MVIRMKKYQSHQKKNDSKNIVFYGNHACFAALANPKRKCLKLFVSQNTFSTLPKNLKLPKVEIIDNNKFDLLLNSKTIPHQGIALEVEALSNPSIDEITGSNIVLILDQLTDPQNVGAILRSAAAFDIGGIITTKDNSPAETGALAKSASGALEIVPIAKVTNLVRTMDELKERGFWCIGLDGNSNTMINDVKKPDKIALILGAEGKGLRDLTIKNCDMVVKLPISRKVESLNVSNAAAIALYHFTQVK